VSRPPAHLRKSHKLEHRPPFDCIALLLQGGGALGAYHANEHADWETAHHVVTYTNALHQMLNRIGTASTDGHVTAMRGLLHGAMALYLTRYLNVPPARIPAR